MGLMKFDWISVVLILLIAIFGNFIFGPLAALISGIAFSRFTQKLIYFFKEKNYQVSIIYLILVLAILISFFLEIWGEHPAWSYEEGKKVIEMHKHYIWEVDHVH